MVAVVPGVGWLSASAKTFVEPWFVGIKGPPMLPALEVHMVSHTTKGVDPSSTHFLSCCLVSGLLGGLGRWMCSRTTSSSLARSNCASVKLTGLDWLLGLCRHSLLSLSVCPGGRVKTMLRFLRRGFDTPLILEWDCAFPLPSVSSRITFGLCCYTTHFLFWLV